MKIVVIGGGAVAKAVLPNLKGSITTITSMTDSGGSTGALRKEFEASAMGDIRRHLLALSDAEDWKKHLFNLRFAKELKLGDHQGHNLGNVILVALEQYFGSFEKTLDFVHKFLSVRGKCLPATLAKVQLYAKLKNGKVIKGEHLIEKAERKHGIKELWLEPKAKAYKKAVEAIKGADLIILGPGDLYSSIIAALLPEGILEALMTTKAKIIFNDNILES